MENVKISWLLLFDKYDKQFEKNTVSQNLSKILDLIKEYNESGLELYIYPKFENIFKCFNYFEVTETKVVILGQDPYHGPNQATGLCFGVNKDIPIPPSLKNIVKELKYDLNIELQDNSLESWAKQGVLMMNASFSVIQGKANSQMGSWNNFTSFIINELNKCDHNIIFVAWGAFAHNKLKNIDLKKHDIIVSSHPSPLSVFKKYKNFPAFSGSKPFSKINQLLGDKNSELIIW